MCLCCLGRLPVCCLTQLARLVVSAAWKEGAASVLGAVVDCAQGHRRAQDAGNVTAAEILQTFHRLRGDTTKRSYVRPGRRDFDKPAEAVGKLLPQTVNTTNRRALQSSCQCGRCVSQCRCGNADSSSACRSCCGGSGSSSSSSSNSCRYANDGECDDGSQGGTAYCSRGTDAADCSSGGSSSHCPSHASSNSNGGCSCDSGYQVNSAGNGCETASTSCPAHSSSNSNGGCTCDSGYRVNSAGNGCETASASCPAHSSSGSNGGCSCDSGYQVNSAGNGCEAASSGGNSCRYAYDGECDDGSQGGSRYCDRGTDEADCGQGSGTVTASSMQHCLNRQASSWFLHRVEVRVLYASASLAAPPCSSSACVVRLALASVLLVVLTLAADVPPSTYNAQDVGCAYISGGCSPCVSHTVRP